MSVSQVYMIQKRCWFSQIFFVEYFLHWIKILFLSSQFYVIHGVRKSIPNWKLSHNPVAKGFSRIAFPITVLPKDDHTDSFQEERLGLPYWTMILAICVVVDEFKCLDTPILEFFSQFVSIVHFYFGCKPILRLLLVHRNPAIWRWYPWSYLLSFEILKILVQWTHKIQNCLLQYHRGAQLDLCISGALPPIRHFSDDTCPLMMQNEL